MKKYYLIAHWSPSRGQTLDNPAYYQGSYGSYFVYAPLRDVDREKCYKSEKRAQRVADKFNERCPFRVYEAVVEVPECALIGETL